MGLLIGFLLPSGPVGVARAVETVVGLTVLVISFRRARHLSRRPVVISAAIGVLSMVFWPLWAIAWAVNHERIAREWAAFRSHQGRPVATYDL